MTIPLDQATGAGVLLLGIGVLLGGLGLFFWGVRHLLSARAQQSSERADPGGATPAKTHLGVDAHA